MSGLLATLVGGFQREMANTLSPSRHQEGSRFTTPTGTSYGDGMLTRVGASSKFSVPQMTKSRFLQREASITILSLRTFACSLRRVSHNLLLRCLTKVNQSWFQLHRYCGFSPVHFFHGV